MHPRSVLTALVLRAGLEMAQADDGVWTTAAGGSRAGAGNWLDGIVADGADNTATFGISLFPVNAAAAFTLNGETRHPLWHPN